MRLINTHTGELKEYTGSYIPRYVALSHRWTDDEITFKDYVKGRRTDSLGYKKILAFREVARSRGVGHIWIDTACIDKRSSSELSEAINSMYNWYKRSASCYAYLADVDDTQETRFQQFRSSVWFTRGWTLQELVASNVVIFFDRYWMEMGVCGSIVAGPASNFTYLISEFTSIPVGILRDSEVVPFCGVADRISWLRSRITTREEDMAYCVMGLLGINMPLLYGEGSRAWYRLQTEILRTTDDESIFAWNCSTPVSRPLDTVPILAPSASVFAKGRRRRNRSFSRPPYTITNQGLELRLKAVTAHKIAFNDEKRSAFFVVPLNTCFGDSGDHTVLLLVSQP